MKKVTIYVAFLSVILTPKRDEENAWTRVKSNDKAWWGIVKINMKTNMANKVSMFSLIQTEFFTFCNFIR